MNKQPILKQNFPVLTHKGFVTINKVQVSELPNVKIYFHHPE